MSRPLILGHRGASAHITENTMEAFELARQQGADGIELDVQMCASGELVVFHDADLARLAGRGEHITAMTLADIAAVRLNHGRRIAMLDDVLGEFARDDFVINIEVKSLAWGRAGALVDGLVELLSRHVSRDRELSIISSFDPVAVTQVRRRAPELRTGLLFHRGEPLPFRRAWVAPVVRPHALHPEHILVTEVSMAIWKKRGYAVNAWTVDEPAELRRLAALGVDGVFTNDPAGALSALTVA
jgi:glycerophosphoryl diester phosphodiesterase